MRCGGHPIINNGNSGDATTGITIKVIVADQILIGRCFKGFRDIDISKGRQSIVLSAK
jgi:hypothetical protein